MNAKTAKLIRKAAKALKEKGIIPNERAASKKVKQDYLKKNSFQKTNFHIALSNIPHHIATMANPPQPALEVEDNLNKSPENLS